MQITDQFPEFAGLPTVFGSFDVEDYFIERYFYSDYFVVTTVYKNGKVLLLRNKHRPFGWELPGGKVEPGEKFYEAARRELYEETGLVVVDLKPIAVVENIFNSPVRTKRQEGVAFYSACNSDINPDTKEIAEYRFFSECPSDMAFSNREIVAASRTYVLEGISFE